MTIPLFKVVSIKDKISNQRKAMLSSVKSKKTSILEPPPTIGTTTPAPTEAQVKLLETIATEPPIVESINHKTKNTTEPQSPRICFITSLVADDYSHADKPAKFSQFGGHKFYLFTNLPKEHFNTGWDVVQIPNVYLENQVGNIANNRNIYASRFMKFMGWKYLTEEMNEHYDVIFYCDAIYEPKKNHNWTESAKQILNNEWGLMQQRHKNTAYNECDVIVRVGKDTKNHMNQMKRYMREHGLPPAGIIMMENTCFGYDPNNHKITNAFSEFWDIYISEQLTFRDQPLWGYVYWKNDIEAVVLSVGAMSGPGRRFERRGTYGFRSHRYA